jgi:hypothetical protein
MIFAILAGAFIVFLAVFATVRIITTSQYAEQSESAKTLLNMLNPIVNDISSAYAPAPINFNKQTRVILGCSMTSDKSRIFGKQTISFSEQSNFLKKWTDPGANVSEYNKYIFANSIEEGKTLYIFTKPFYAGYKVDDLVFLSMENYCFVNAPNFIRGEIEDLNLKNINFSSKIDKCFKGDIKVCFNFDVSGCNMSVYPDCRSYCNNDYEGYDIGYVEKDGKTLTYFGSLMYGAIFSSPQIYECNSQRLGNKISELGKIYKDKIDILKSKNCNTIIGSYIDQIIDLAGNVSSSSKLAGVYEPAMLMDEKNCDDNLCRIYRPENC